MPVSKDEARKDQQPACSSQKPHWYELFLDEKHLGNATMPMVGVTEHPWFLCENGSSELSPHYLDY